MTESYNGWANYETWNVALWIQNDEGIHDTARFMKRKLNPYITFRNAMRDCGFRRTPDGVDYNDAALDIAELDTMIRDL